MTDGERVTRRAFPCQEVINILNDLNPWRFSGKMRKPPPPYQRRGVPDLLKRMERRQGLIEVVRGRRQVGKTTAIEQIVHHMLSTHGKKAVRHSFREV